MSSEAATLLNSVVREFSNGYGFGSMSYTVYDTAWISCVTKLSDTGLRQWLFPASFIFILDAQHEDGGWHWPPQTNQDCVDSTIVSSLAAVFAFTQHVKDPLQLYGLQDRLLQHLQRGKRFLESYLKRLENTSYYSVGFELCAPTLLDLLEKEDIVFDFPGRQELFQRRNAKLSRVPLGSLHDLPSTMLHSLEALYGTTGFSFDTLRCRLVSGSMMASPSATAAYLMKSCSWDESAEAYLRLVLSNSDGQSIGAVPSAFPSTNFELVWVTSTLLKARCVDLELFEQDGGKILDIFQRQIPEDDLVGFAPGIQPDVDDSAKASIVLSLLGRQGLSRRIRQQFETASHFETYKSESNASLSANCNVLLALLLGFQEDPEAASAISKVSKYLAATFFDTNGPVRDKWNVSEYYPSMLLSQAFMKLLHCWETSQLPFITEVFIRDQVIVVTYQVLLRVLQTQNCDGSWGSKGPCEESAYAVLTLMELSGLPMASLLDQQVQTGIDRGREYINAHSQASIPEYLWVEKVLYGVRNISQTYVVAALAMPKPRLMDGYRIQNLLNINYDGFGKFAGILQKVPLLALHPRWLIDASLIEGQLFLPMLRAVREAVFIRIGMTKDTYFNWIPAMWTLANSLNGRNTSARLLYDMMRISVLNFQVDEFMEATMNAEYNDNVLAARDLIEDVFKRLEPIEQVSKACHGVTGINMNINNADHKSLSIVQRNAILTGKEAQEVKTVKDLRGDAGSTADDKIVEAACNGHNSTSSVSSPAIPRNLQLFVKYIMDIAKAAKVNAFSCSEISTEVKRFLHAHLTQIELNMDFSAKRRIVLPSHAPVIYSNPKESFRHWLNNTSAVNTSCLYSFALYLALASAPQKAHLLRTPRQTYVAQELCTHLSKMCRLYNDYGSLTRDLAEGNLNCVNFPEFHMASGSWAVDGPSGGDRLMESLMALANWERKGLEMALKELEGFSETDTGLIKTLKVFIDVTDLFGQVYVVKDLGSRKL